MAIFGIFFIRLGFWLGVRLGLWWYGFVALRAVPQPFVIVRRTPNSLS